MRIMIFGRPGSGKSTFSVELAQKLNISLYHLDRYFYTSNWVERNYEEFIQIQKKLVTEENWIIDGNATKSFEIRYKHADIAIYFCYPRLRALWRIIKRRFFSKKDCRIYDRAEGCKETISWSLIKYMWSFEERVKDQIRELAVKYPNVKLYIIHNDKERRKVMEILTKDLQ